MATTARVSQLGRWTNLAAAPSGVYRLASYRLPGFAELAFSGFHSAAEVANLTALVEFRSLLDTHRRAVLDNATVWPLRLLI